MVLESWGVCICYEDGAGFNESLLDYNSSKIVPKFCGEGLIAQLYVLAKQMPDNIYMDDLGQHSWAN